MHIISEKLSASLCRKRAGISRSLLLLLFVIGIMLSIAPASLALEVGSGAPDFELETLDGRLIRLSDFRGSPVILKLATTWCPTCQQQVAAIDSLADVLAKEGVVLVEIFVGESAETVQHSLTGRTFPFRQVTLLDPAGAVFNDLYHGYVVPRVLLLDKDLRIRHDGTLLDAEQLKRLLLPLLTGSTKTYKKI